MRSTALLRVRAAFSSACFGRKTTTRRAGDLPFIFAPPSSHPLIMAASSSTDPPDQNVVTPLFGETFTDVGQDYSLGKRLGSGNFAKVVLGELKRAQPQWKLKAGDAVAIKVVKKPSSRKAIERVQMLKAEVEILRSIHHPNIVRLFEIYESPARLYLVMELLTGGELFDRIVGLGKYSEEDARYFTFKLLNAVLYLHDREICHRDLKPENILLASKSSDAELKITDFGLSKIVALVPDAMMSTRCGTPGYAPRPPSAAAAAAAAPPPPAPPSPSPPPCAAPPRRRPSPPPPSTTSATPLALPGTWPPRCSLRRRRTARCAATGPRATCGASASSSSRC